MSRMFRLPLIGSLSTAMAAGPFSSRLRVAFVHPAAPGRKPSGVRAARRAARKHRNRERSQ